MTRMGAQWVDAGEEPLDIHIYEDVTQASVEAMRSRVLSYHDTRAPSSSNGINLRWPLRQHAVLSQILDLLGHLPVQKSHEDIGNTPESEALVKLRILVVDDNPINQRVAQAMLRRMGLDADIASNGEQALELTTHGHYDVILMDMQMPVMDGLSATRKIRTRLQSESQPYIFALTASTPDREQAECIDAGMNGFLIKPIRIGTLRAALEQCIADRCASVEP